MPYDNESAILLTEPTSTQNTNGINSRRGAKVLRHFIRINLFHEKTSTINYVHRLSVQ